MLTPPAFRSLDTLLAGCVLTLALHGCAATLRPAGPGPAEGEPAPVPLPASMVPRAGAPFVLARATAIVTAPDPSTRGVAEALGRLLRPATGLALPIVTDRSPLPGDISLRLDSANASLGDEGYALEVDTSGVRIGAHRAAGLFHGIQTLRQLLPARIESDIHRADSGWIVAPVIIRDAPRFAWRGAMLDVARHFFTVREVEQYIDILAMYKLNVLHLHLADDQGWRIEIRSRPPLTAVGAATQVGARDGGFYTQDDFARLVRYAADRFVTIVPEIDMPGHSNAALSAYPGLSCGKRPPGLYSGIDVGWSTLCVEREETYALVEDVVRELAAISPGPYIHIGGDEVESLTPAQYARFVERVQDIVARHGKRMAGWEEIAHARLAPGTMVQQWHTDSVVKALAMGASIVLSPASHTYLDMQYEPSTALGLHWAGYVNLRTAYLWDPATLIPGVTEANVLGVEAPLWSETVRNITAAEYLAMPRLPAIAEVGWTPQASRQWDDFARRLAPHAIRWQLLGINFHPSSEIAW